MVSGMMIGMVVGMMVGGMMVGGMVVGMMVGMVASVFLKTGDSLFNMMEFSKFKGEFLNFLHPVLRMMCCLIYRFLAWIARKNVSV